jgi:ribosomal protein S9
MFRGQDRQLTALARGETVVNRKQSRRFFSELNAMNQGSQPVYRDQGGPVTNVGDVNVTVQGGDTSQQTVRGIGHALRRELKRGNITLR